jgi:hypothetical protein
MVSVARKTFHRKARAGWMCLFLLKKNRTGEDVGVFDSRAQQKNFPATVREQTCRSHYADSYFRSSSGEAG